MNLPTRLHWQLTRACNLSCPFCGQRRGSRDGELGADEWQRLADEAAAFAPRPRVTLWGGEPLRYPDFAAVATHALDRGLALELVTNGVELARHAALLRRFERLYVSVDGPEEVHDAVRGRGVFARVAEGLAAVGAGGPERVLMTVLAPETLARADEAPYGLPAERVILHRLIYLAPDEHPGDADDGAAWRKNYRPDYPARLAETLARLRKGRYPVPVEYQPHGAGGPCREPSRHLHIGAGGETGFCTDFTGYTLGNVREFTMREIFSGPAARTMRARIADGGWAYCAHCSWRNTARTVERFATEPATAGAAASFSD